jgi:hypothetical protein
MAIVIQAETNEPNALLFKNSGGAPKSRVDAAGTFISGVQAPPAEADLAIGECAWWLDLEEDYVRFLARKDSTTWLTASVKLGS